MSKPIKSSGEDQPYHYWAFIRHGHQDNLATRGGGGGGDDAPGRVWQPALAHALSFA